MNGLSDYARSLKRLCREFARGVTEFSKCRVRLWTKHKHGWGLAVSPPQLGPSVAYVGRMSKRVVWKGSFS